MKCKNCQKKESVKYSKYSNGEFCCKSCSASYSTRSKRSEINKKTSLTMLEKFKYIEKKEKYIDKECLYCKDIFRVLSKRRKKKYCGEICRKKNAPIRLKKIEEPIKNKCQGCNSEYLVYKKNKNQIFCGRSCASRYAGKIGGLQSVMSQKRRSKNEIYFGELCKQKFNNVKFNESMFNGWDADVVIEDLKLAVLWNGKWHYEKITKQHSVNQVQNRDKIKLEEIERFGYKAHIIKDMGKYNKTFVEEEFEKFILNLSI